MAKIIEDGKRVIFDNYKEYVELQNGRAHNYDCPNCLKQNLENMAELLKINGNIKSILDVGSRDSSYFDRFPSITFVGIDISSTSVEYAKSKGRNVILCDVNELTSHIVERFDAVMSNHSLEHFLDPLFALNECYKILNPEGLILIRLPNENKIGEVKYAHVRTFTHEELINIIKKASFKIITDIMIGDNFMFIGQK